MIRPLAHATILTLVCGLPVWAGASQPLPTPFPEARYRAMTVRSPFAMASASAAAPAVTPGFAAQLYVDGVAHFGTTDYVAIKSRDAGNPTTLFVEVGKSTTDGLKVERVVWSDVTGKSRVEVSKGGERATLVFDQAQIVGAAGPAQPILPPMNRPAFYLPGAMRHRNPLDPLQ